MKHQTIIEPFRIKVVEPIAVTSYEERKKHLIEAHYNPFLLESHDVLIDLLTDSGTSAMSSGQWSAIMNGDESYAGSDSWNRMRAVIDDITGYPHILPTHQGRAGERILYTMLGGKGKYFINNTHFDTTRANIEYSGATAIDCLIEVGSHPEEYHPFKGNMDIERLEKYIKKFKPENIGAIILTITNNTGGGQPVSMENARQISEICKKYKLIFILDACRVAENAYFIRDREPGFEDKTYLEIAREMFGLADGCVMSVKKDGFANIGGFLALKNEELSQACTNLLIITEGFSTYGGLAGRDMEAIAVGLEEVFHADYLHYRIKSTTYVGNRLSELGIPIIKPVGGHAVYVDAKALYDHIPVDQYPGQSLVCNLYLEGGVRSVEVGSVMFGKYDDQGKLIPSPMELVRLAIPRRVYTKNHMDYVIETFGFVVEEKNKAKGMKITYEPKYLRHFTAHFEPI